MPRPYQRRHVDADFTGHAPHRRDPNDTPPITITEETQRSLVQLAENQRALSTILPSIGTVSSVNNMLRGVSPGANYTPELEKINDQRPPLGQMLGVPGIPIFDGVINDPAEYNKDFYWRDGVAKYDEMYRSDPQVRQATAVMARPIRRAHWDIQPVSDAKIDQEIASAVKSALFDDMCYYTDDGEEIIQTWDDILKHLLLMFVYGFSTMEYVWRKDKDGWTKWACWAPILPRTVWRWWTGGSGELLGIQQYAYKDGVFQLIEIPAKKILRVAYDQQANNYDGLSPLRSSYPHWFYKTQYEAIESVGIERVGIPMPVFSLPATASAADYAKATQMAQNIRANEKMNIVKPVDWGLDYLQGQANFDQIHTAIEFHDRQIARNVGAMFLNLGGERGAFNLDKSQTQTFMQAIQAEADYIAERISASAIRKFIKANYDGVKVYPKLVCSKISTQDIEDLGKSIAAMAGFINPDPTLEDWLREEMGLPKAAPTQDPYTINSDTPMGGEGDNGPGDGGSDGSDNGGDNSGDNSGDKSNNSSQSGGQDDSEEGANDSGDSGASGDGYAEPATSSWLLDETMDAVERGILHMAKNAETGESVKLGFGSFAHFGARPIGGFGGEHLEIRRANGEFAGRRAGMHGAQERLSAHHHEAVEERGGGMRGRPRIHENDSARQQAYYKREQEAGRDPMGRKNELARARRLEAFNRRQAQIERSGENGGRVSENMPRAALLHRIAEVSPVANGRSTSDITWRGADGNILHPAGNGMRARNGDTVSEAMRLSASRVEQEMRESPTMRLVGVSQTGQVHELGAHPRDLRGIDANTLAQLQGGVIIVNHPLGSAPRLSEMGAAAHVGAVQLRVVTPFYRHAISSANARQAINAEATRHLAPLYRHTTSVVTAQVKDAIALKQVSPWHAARQIGHVVWQRVAQPAKLHYVRAAWDEDSALMREQDDESVKLFGFGGFRIGSGPRGGLGGIGGGADRATYGPHHQFTRSRKGEHNEASVHEHTSARHHGDDEHGGGQGHGGSRGEHEKSATERTAEHANKGAARRTGEKATGGARAKKLTQREQFERDFQQNLGVLEHIRGGHNMPEHVYQERLAAMHAHHDKVIREMDAKAAARRSAGKAKGEGAAKAAKVTDTQFEHSLIAAHQRHVEGTGMSSIKRVRADVMRETGMSRADFDARILAMRHAGKGRLRAELEINDTILRGHAVKAPESESHGLESHNARHYDYLTLYGRSGETFAKAPAAPKAPKAPRQSAAERNAAEIAALHETSAKWQAQPGHAKESPPSEHGKVTNGRLAPDAHFEVKQQDEGFLNPAAAPDPHMYARVYGEENVGALLMRATTPRLRETATEQGLTSTGSREHLISRITAAATHGHYSANFPHEAKASAKAPKVAKATKPAEEMTHEELLAHVKELEAGKGASRAARELPRTSDIAKPLTAIRPIHDYEIRLRAAPDVRLQTFIFGHGQLREVMGQRSVSDVRKAAHEIADVHGVARSTAKSKNDLIDFIVKEMGKESVDSLRDYVHSLGLRPADEE